MLVHSLLSGLRSVFEGWGALTLPQGFCAIGLGNQWVMPDWLRFVLVWSIPVVLMVGGIAGNVWVIRRNRRRAREHPEQVPRGKRLIARIAPFAALMVVLAVYNIAIQEWTVVFFAAVALACFGWQAYKAATDPNYPPPPKR